MVWQTPKENIQLSVSSINLNVDDLETYTSNTVINTASMSTDLDELTTAPVFKTLGVVTKKVVISGTALPIMAAQTFARKVYLNARRPTAANSNMVYVGNSDVDYATDQQLALAPGDSITLDAGLGCKYDLNKIYVDTIKSSDCVTGLYEVV